MNEPFKDDGASGIPGDERELVVLIKKLQQHMEFLEKKIDTLISLSSARFVQGQGRHFSKPFRPGGHSRPHIPGERGNRSGDRNFSQGRPFDQPHGEPSQRFSQHKKPFFHRKKDRH